MILLDTVLAMGFLLESVAQIDLERRIISLERLRGQGILIRPQPMESDPPSLDALWSAWQGGEAEAFERLYREVSPGLYALCLGLSRGTGIGAAFQFAHSGYVAYVVELTVDGNKAVSVKRAWCAVDIGRQVPEGIDAARAFGCGAYISWMPEKDRFFINTIIARKRRAFNG